MADRDIRLNRILIRDGIDENSALQRISVQNDIDYYEGLADIIIENNGSISELKALAEQVENEIRRSADETRR